MSLFEIRPVPGKGFGLVAAVDLEPGTCLLSEEPLIVLDPPTKRNDLLKLIGCRQFASLDMKRSTPDQLRRRICQLVLERQVEALPEADRRQMMSLSDRLSEPGHDPAGRTPSGKTPWGVWQTNSLPLGTYRASGLFPRAARLNHSCRPNAHQFWSEEHGEQRVFCVEQIERGQEITVSYVRTFCSRAFRQSLLRERFGFDCACRACELQGGSLARDDALRLEIDRLSQLFAQARQEDGDLSTALSLGERLLSLMDEAGFSPSVQWPGLYRCFELHMRLGDGQRARRCIERAHELACVAQGPGCKEACRLQRYRQRPEQYLEDEGLVTSALASDGSVDYEKMSPSPCSSSDSSATR